MLSNDSVPYLDFYRRDIRRLLMYFQHHFQSSRDHCLLDVISQPDQLVVVSASVSHSTFLIPKSLCNVQDFYEPVNSLMTSLFRFPFDSHDFHIVKPSFVWAILIYLPIVFC